MKPANSFADKAWYRQQVAESRDLDRLLALRRINRERYMTDSEWCEYRRLWAKHGDRIMKREQQRRSYHDAHIETATRA